MGVRSGGRRRCRRTGEATGVQRSGALHFGYSDLLRNHNKYAGNTTDGYENPFYTTPQRSPLDNLTFSIGVSYRFNKSGFTEWNNRPPKRDKNKEVFNYKGVTK